jgi:hypothetical protein
MTNLANFLTDIVRRIVLDLYDTEFPSVKTMMIMIPL